MIFRGNGNERRCVGAFIPDRKQKEITKIYDLFGAIVKLREIRFAGPGIEQKFIEKDIPATGKLRQTESEFINNHPVPGKISHLPSCPECINFLLHESFAKRQAEAHEKRIVGGNGADHRSVDRNALLHIAQIRHRFGKP